jgi:hypothetical protein
MSNVFMEGLDPPINGIWRHNMSNPEKFTVTSWEDKNHEQGTNRPPLNRHDRRLSMKRAKSLNRAIKRFVEIVTARSPALQNLDKEITRAEAQKIFIREAKKLVKKQKVAIPQIMRDQGITYEA